MDWVKKIDQLLVELDKRPQFRFQAPTLQPIEKTLSNLIGSEVHLELTLKGWKKKEECPLSNHFLFSIFSSTLGSSFFFLAEKKSTQLLLEDPLLAATNAEMVHEITEGFLHYLLIEALLELQKQQGLSSLTLTVQSEKKSAWEEESYFCFELLCKTATASAACKIYIPPSFRTAFEKHFSQVPSLPFSNEMKESIFLDLSIEVGSSLVKQKELKQLKLGDFLLLDRCLYDPDSKKGAFLLMLEEVPIFRGKVTQEGCKLAEIPVYQEVQKMDENNKEEDSFYEEESLFDEDEELSLESNETGTAPIQEKAQEKVQAKPSASQATAIRLDELELNVKVELCRLKMTAKGLSELSIGNLLPLDVTIDRGVDLVVNGKRFARGELLRMGEHLGVRILEIAGH